MEEAGAIKESSFSYKLDGINNLEVKLIIENWTIFSW